jgi:2-polyprenyl-3-methyl-5-hydroxy-6-metoxy-1,4-benzoquinol methylase
MTEVSARDFNPIAESLRREVLAFYRERGEEISGPAGLNTLETNSGFVERRGQPLVEILDQQGGLDSLARLRLLDLGCGFGALSAFFAARGATVIGVDAKEDRLEVGRKVAAEHSLDVQFQEGRMQHLDLTDETFDVVVENNSLCYVVPREDRRAVLSESLRVLRPGGHLVIRNPNRWSTRDQFTGLPLIQLLPPRQAVAVARRLGRDRSLVRLTSGPEAIRELRRAGFERVRNVSPPEHSWPSFMRPVARYQHLIARRPR